MEEEGQPDQHCVKNNFVKNRLGGRGSALIWIMSLNILLFFLRVPLMIGDLDVGKTAAD